MCPVQNVNHVPVHSRGDSRSKGIERSRLLAVELAAAVPVVRTSEFPLTLIVLLPNKRQVEVRRGLDQDTPAQLLTVLEKLQAVFGVGAATRNYLAPGATDMRKGFNGLYGLVRDQLLCDPLSGHLFLFSNAQHNRLKILFWDHSGIWVCAKKLEKGRFYWPESDTAENKIVLSHEGLALLLGGIDLDKTRQRWWYHRVSSEEPGTTRNSM